MTDQNSSPKIQIGNIFIITSTINTPLGLISLPQRYQQTIDTISSIRRKVPDVAIVLVDNSILPLPVQWQVTLQQMSDVFLMIGRRRICHAINSLGIKGAGECYMLLVALDWISREFLVQNRIFKISGRYVLGQNFDYKAYAGTQGKYCFKTRGTNDCGRSFLHTRLWSCCASLQTHMIDLVRKSFQIHLEQQLTIEEVMYDCIDQSLLVEHDHIHCEGFIAPWNVWIID